MSRMIDYGQTCATCRHLGNAQFLMPGDGERKIKQQCLQERRLPVWVELSDRCDKWAPRAPGDSK